MKTDEILKYILTSLAKHIFDIFKDVKKNFKIQQEINSILRNVYRETLQDKIFEEELNYFFGIPLREVLKKDVDNLLNDFYQFPLISQSNITTVVNNIN